MTTEENGKYTIENDMPITFQRRQGNLNRLRPIFSRPPAARDSSPDATSNCDLHPITYIPPIPSSTVIARHVPQARDLSVQNYSMDNRSFSAYLDRLESIVEFVGPEVTITAFTEMGQAESSIKVPLQRSYTGTEPVIPSALADTPCATLGVPGLLDLFNSTLVTSHTLDTPSLSSVLEDCIKNNYDVGTAYGRLRVVWRAYNDGTIQEELRKREADDREMRQEFIVGNRIVRPCLEPRRVWDLYTNRVVRWWSIAAPLDEPKSLCSCSMSKTMRETCSNVRPISHAWIHAKDRVNVQTPINGYEWPVPIPKDASIDLIRIEMLNLGVEYTWLDVLCLRQKGGTREDLREEEWKLDVPTIGSVYHLSEVVIYLSGLGRPLTLKEGDLESDQCWFRRAWTLQEVGERRIIAGDMPDGPLHAEPIGKDDTGILTRFHNQLGAINAIHHLSRSLSLSPGMFDVLSEMQNRVSTNPVDKVVGLAHLLLSRMIPAYHESESLEDAWTALVNEMTAGNRGELFFWYPEPGDAGKKWRPSWEQVMNKCLPANQISNMDIGWDGETDDAWYKGPCVDKGLVWGLAAGGAEKVARRGKFIVKDSDGMEHAFGIIAHHGYPIPEGTYTLLGTDLTAPVRRPVRIRGRLRLRVQNSRCRTQYWVIGRRLSDGKFEKVSVFEMADEKEVWRLSALGITEKCRNVLI